MLYLSFAPPNAVIQRAPTHLPVEAHLLCSFLRAAVPAGKAPRPGAALLPLLAPSHELPSQKVSCPWARPLQPRHAIPLSALSNL